MQESQHKLLIVVRDSLVRNDIVSMLQQAGFPHLILLDDGQAAISALKQHAFTALICDIDLTPVDGWRVARLIRSGMLATAADCPIMMIATSWSEHIANMTAREYGVSRVVPLNQLSNLVPFLQQHLTARATIHALRLLIVEDDPEIAQIAERSLRNRFSIDIATDGHQALQLWQQQPYDLVLLDMMLPRMSGEEVLEQMVRQQPQQPVVIMTAHASVDLAERLIMKGAVDFICKPFKVNELQKVCETAIRRKDYLLSHHQFEQHVEILRQRENALNQLYHAHNQLLNNLSVTVLEMDARGRIGFANQAWMKTSGYSLAETVGQTIYRFMPEYSPSARLLQHLLQDITRFRNYSKNIELQLQHKYGDMLWVELKLAPLNQIDDSEDTRISVCMENITNRKHAQQRLEYLAMHDSLTGLFNRRYFEMQLKQLTQKARLNRHQHALLYIDLDHFKVINDSIGHHHGDTVIKEVSNNIALEVASTDILARLGGDEYGIIIQNATTQEVEQMALQILAAVERYQYQLDNQLFELSCSIGVVMIDGEDDTSPEQYLMRADSALYVAKKRGRNQWHQHSMDDTESAELRNSMDWLRRVRKAIQQDDLELYLQPIYKSANGQVEYYEALTRMHLPEQGVVGPGAFMPALEKLGETVPLDYWVIDNAIKLLACYPELHCIGINLSAHAFAEQQLVTQIENKLLYYQVKPERMVFELTESISLANLSQTQSIIANLQQMGSKFAIDDFGTGFSTFNYLKQLPADYVKVDGSFVVNLVNDCVDQALVHSIADIARALKIKTIAEFVENESTLNLLRKMGIDCVQGFHTGKPKPVGDILRMVKVM